MTQEEKTELLKIDICARLPYGVRYYDLGYDDAPKIEAYHSDDYADWEENETGGFFAIGRRIVFREDMPLLRPLSDLCTKITHTRYNNGKPFVPIVECAEIGLELQGRKFILGHGSFISNEKEEYHIYGCENDDYQFAYHTDKKSFIVLAKKELLGSNM